MKSKKIVVILCIALLLSVSLSVMGTAAVTAPCIAGKWNYPQDSYGWKGTMTITQKGSAITGTLKSGGWTRVYSGKSKSNSVASGSIKLTPHAADGTFTFTVNKNGKTISVTNNFGGHKTYSTMTKISASKCS